MVKCCVMLTWMFQIIFVDVKLGHYIMVLKYADSGNLRHYLQEKFLTLTLSDKLRMATEITRGLMCLHIEEIIHRDLVKKKMIFL